MTTPKALRLCIMGPSGVGKSPLSRLLNVQGWEPFRVRVPRNAEDAKVCKTPDEYAALEEAHRSEAPLYEGPTGNPNKLRIYRSWSFFEVRGGHQCLEHTPAAKDPAVSLRVEIFAPVLLEILQNLANLREAFALTQENLLLLLLNPTSRQFRDMSIPSEELRLATLVAVTERDRVTGKAVDLADALRRVEHLAAEVSAWSELCTRFPHNTVECLAWPHFEFRYTQLAQGPWHASAELDRARSTVLKA
ncbi:MAG: hypothetical protein ACREXY_27670, partial [Gammaproteobacteria bacterium]